MSLANLHELDRRGIAREVQKTKRAMFIGRWQPFHNGHKWLISQKLSEDHQY